MKISFEKYHGTGNDFILIDNRTAGFHFSADQIAFLCHRHFGIGADGLILIQKKAHFDFEMIYFNSDGKHGSMCGNGGRCAVMFAHKLGMIEHAAKFSTGDGEHTALIKSDDVVKLSMADVKGIDKVNHDFILNTGSPHYVKFVSDVNQIDVVREGRLIRYNEHFRSKGINVNFVSQKDGVVRMRTYERGVEDETFSCGTGTVAVAIATFLENWESNQKQEYQIQALGGKLKVYFTPDVNNTFTEVALEGPASFVFSGEIEI
ncbi:MAG: diaminopimelate epimerase [Chitinophagales bacterium]